MFLKISRGQLDRNNFLQVYSKVDSAKCQTKGAESSVSESRALVPVILCLELECCFGQ